MINYEQGLYPPLQEMELLDIWMVMQILLNFIIPRELHLLKMEIYMWLIQGIIGLEN